MFFVNNFNNATTPQIAILEKFVTTFDVIGDMDMELLIDYINCMFIELRLMLPNGKVNTARVLEMLDVHSSEDKLVIIKNTTPCMVKLKSRNLRMRYYDFALCCKIDNPERWGFIY